MSERTVPRRESPWGMPEGDHRQPKAHRCNDRAEDVIQETQILLNNPKITIEVVDESSNTKMIEDMACFEGNPFKTVPGPFKLFWQCMRSKPGEEPTQPFFYLELDPPTREVKLE